VISCARKGSSIRSSHASCPPLETTSERPFTHDVPRLFRRVH
jgi:hypothetical protein